MRWLRLIKQIKPQIGKGSRFGCGFIKFIQQPDIVPPLFAPGRQQRRRILMQL